MTENITGLDALMKKTGSLTVAFIGGSITEGTDRATPGCFYVDIAGNFFREHYGTQKVNIINAGWGGTGSEFGLFRLKNDVMQHNPDMVFVEFAANDVLKDSFSIKLYMENIVRNLCTLPKQPVINFIYATDNQYNATIAEHEEIARYYNIPSINILEYIRSEIAAGKFTFDEIFGDKIHPNDRGYRIYADFIIKTIFTSPEKYFVLPTAKKEQLIPREIKNPSIVPASKALQKGNWTLCRPVNRHLSPAVSSSDAGDKLIFEFDGDYIGILCEDMYLDGEALCTLDGNTLGRVKPVAYAPAMICDKLNCGHHTLTLEVLPGKPFRAAGFMVNGL